MNVLISQLLDEFRIECLRLIAAVTTTYAAISVRLLMWASQSPI